MQKPQQNQTCNNPQIVSANKETVKLFIMVHGLNGSRNDLVKISESILLLIPEAKFYFCSANELECRDGLTTMAYRLATEIDKLMLLSSTVSSLKISFVCHSFGGLVVRDAIKFLGSIRHHFVSYISLCTPHLGPLSDRFLVRTGLKFLALIPKHDTYDELALKDRLKALVKLSSTQEISWFKNIILVGTLGDGMVNYKSALIQLPEGSNDSRLAQMVKNLTEQMRNSKVFRYPITINESNNKLDDYFVGNKIHIKVLHDASIHMPILQEAQEFLI